MSAKITGVESHILTMPVKIRLSTGDVRETTHLITEICTDYGIVGVGEGTPYALRGESGTDMHNAYLLCAKIAKKLVGKHLREAKVVLPQIQTKLMRKSFFDYGPFLALETAVIDALSKTDKVPFSVILGGVHRNKVPVCGIVFLDAPQKMALTAQKCVSKGVRHLKVKVTGRNEVDFVNLKHIRQAIGYGPMIRIDANGAYKTVDRAIKAINDLNKYDISIVEQPLLWDNLDGLKELKRKVAPKIMVDESLRSPSDVALISKKKAADIVNFHPPKLGCLSLTRETIKRTVDLGLEYIIGSTVMTGIGVATHLHLAASMKNLHYPNEEIGLYEMFGTDVVMNPLRIVDGFMGIPRAYGIGVKIEEKKLKEYEINMNSLGALLRQTASRTYLRSPSLAKRAVRKALSPWLERYSKCLKNKRK